MPTRTAPQPPPPPPPPHENPASLRLPGLLGWQACRARDPAAAARVASKRRERRERERGKGAGGDVERESWTETEPETGSETDRERERERRERKERESHPAPKPPPPPPLATAAAISAASLLTRGRDTNARLRGTIARAAAGVRRRDSGPAHIAARNLRGHRIACGLLCAVTAAVMI